MKKEQKKYCIWDKRVDLCVATAENKKAINKLYNQLKRNSPNRYEIREVK